MKLQNQKQLKHINHIEELIFTDKDIGLLAVKYIFKSFQHNARKNLRVKIDGAPSLICGWKDDKFFVATKSLFNKTPKINYTPEDIKTNHDNSDLQNKLFYALKYLPGSIPNNGIYYQGDVLFIDSDLKNDSGTTEFTPNILTYTTDNYDGKQKFGIVFHTSYEENLANYDPDLSQLKESDSVFMFDNALHDADIKLNSSSILNINDLNNYNLSKDLISIIDQYGTDLIKFFNSIIKDNPEDFTKTSEYLFDKFEPTIKEKKYNRENFLKLFKLHGIIVKIKSNIIDELNKKQFVLDVSFNGEPTSQEGFIFLTQYGVVKLIDRQEFSNRNFNSEKF